MKYYNIGCDIVDVGLRDGYTVPFELAIKDIHTYMYMCIYIYIYTYVCVCTYIYIYI